MAFTQKIITIIFCFYLLLLILDTSSAKRRRCKRKDSCARCTESRCHWCEPENPSRDGFCGSRSRMRRECDGEVTSKNNYEKVEASVICNEAGTYECGKCTCDEGYYGSHCECHIDATGETCMMTPNSDPCEGRGDCICGECYCHPIRRGSSRRYSGQYCQCNDYSCDFYRGLLCGGLDRGECHCGQCICKPDYTGEACECPLSSHACLASNGQVCNGNGQCVCGNCVCEEPFRGPTCEDHPYAF